MELSDKKYNKIMECLNKLQDVLKTLDPKTDMDWDEYNATPVGQGYRQITTIQELLDENNIDEEEEEDDD